MKAISAGRNLLVVAGLGMFLAAPASAAIVTTWRYTLSSQFTSATFNDDDADERDLSPLQISWGNELPPPPPRSSLTLVNPPQNSMVDTLTGPLPPGPSPFIGIGNSITHLNNTIPSANADLSLARLQSTLTVQGLVPAGGAPLALPNLVFDILFKETPNQGTCAAESPPGNPCNDIFVLVAGFLDQDFMYDSGDGVPVTYFVNVFPLVMGVLGELTPAECAAAGVPDPDDGCLGFTTPEGLPTTLPFGFTISTKPLGMPEPGSLALLGAALLAVGFLRVRRKS